MSRPAILSTILLVAGLGALACSGPGPAAGESAAAAPMVIERHAVSREHPRLLGSLERLQRLAVERPEAYARMSRVAREVADADEHSRLISLALVAAIEDDSTLGRQAIGIVFEKYIDKEVRSGHVTFGHDLAHAAIVFDHCFKWWNEEEKQAFYNYMDATIDANVQSEPSVLHNAWYGYKHWGYGLAAYASYYEHERSPQVLADPGARVHRARRPGAGAFRRWRRVRRGLLHPLLVSTSGCSSSEVARLCEGVDYYALAPRFWRQTGDRRHVRVLPGHQRAEQPPADPHGRWRRAGLGGERDKALSSRRILVSSLPPRSRPTRWCTRSTRPPRCRASPTTATRTSSGATPPCVKGDLAGFKLSHFSPGAGYVFARSSWEEDATYFFFKCGDRFTAHQHLDIGHFLISKYEELASDGGQYYYFGNDHDVNYHLRTIAHSTLLVYDPAETWHNLRAYQGPTTNDGGQWHDWPHHNGAVSDADDWWAGKELYDIADILAFEDHGDYLYVAGDCARAYRPEKLDFFTRQIVYLRPGTFVIFDRVQATKAEYEKTWLLQAMKVPERREDGTLVVTNGRGRLFVQTVLPENPRVKLNSGDSLYCYRGGSHPDEEQRGPAPECRVEICPSVPAATDYFLHVLTAVDSGTESVPAAQLTQDESAVTVELEGTRITFRKDRVGGEIHPAGGASRLLVLRTP